jgi:uncharacterized membrane protein YphA (DoxX/SURF4 family)
MATVGVISESPRLPDAWGRPFLLVGRILLGAIFFLFAFQTLHFGSQWHLGDYYYFSAIFMYFHGLLPWWAARWIAAVLPWIELALGLLLTIGAGLRWAASVASGVLLICIGTMARTQVLGLDTPVFGFGDIHIPVLPAMLLRDSSLLVLALGLTIGAFLIKKRKTTVSS